MSRIVTMRDLEGGRIPNYRRRTFVWGVSPAVCGECGETVCTHRLAGTKLPPGWEVLRTNGRVAGFRCPDCAQADGNAPAWMSDKPADRYRNGVERR